MVWDYILSGDAETVPHLGSQMEDIANRILLSLPQSSLKRLWPALELRILTKR
jgi:hypothetical protein